MASYFNISISSTKIQVRIEDTFLSWKKKTLRRKKDEE